MRIISLGDRISPPGQANTQFKVHSRFDRVINFAPETPECGARMISLVAPEVGNGPGNIVLEDFDSLAQELPKTRSFSLTIEDSVIRVSKLALPIENAARYKSKLALTPLYSGPDLLPLLQFNVEFLGQYVVSHSPGKSLAVLLDSTRMSEFQSPFDRKVIAQFHSAIAQLKPNEYGAIEDLSRAFTRLHGLGWGLTPSGDDFIAGLLLAREIQSYSHPTIDHSLGSFKVSLRSNSLADTFILDALESRFTEPLAQLAQSLVVAKGTIHSHAARVLEHGASSGADTLTGLVIGLRDGLWKH